jgi:UDP-glucose 6-dehydrogenase
VKALIHTAQQAGFAPTLLNAVEARNQAQREVLAEKIAAYYAGNVDSAGHAGTVAADVGHTSGVGNAVSHDSHRAANAGPAASPGQPLQGKTVALWGLAFKPNTDDMREAPSRVIIEELLKRGARVQAYDPVAREEAQRVMQGPDWAGLSYAEHQKQALEGADALLIVTEWKEFRTPDFDTLRDCLKDKRVFDGRNLYEPELIRTFGIEYLAIGRP